MGSLHSKETLPLSQEAQVIIDEYNLLRESRASIKIHELYRAWSRERRYIGPPGDSSPILLVQTPSGWVARKLIEKDLQSSSEVQDLIHARYLDDQEMPSVAYVWKFDHSRVTDVKTRKTDIGYKVLSAAAYPDNQIICSFFRKDFYEEPKHIVEPLVFDRNDWQVSAQKANPVEKALNELVRDNISFPLFRNK